MGEQMLSVHGLSDLIAGLPHRPLREVVAEVLTAERSRGDLDPTQAQGITAGKDPRVILARAVRVGVRSPSRTFSPAETKQIHAAINALHNWP
jgi:hypothetical protein